MSPHPLAGRPAPASLLVDVEALLGAYETIRPDPGVAAQRVSFGTSGHRGTSLDGSFNEAHILAIAQAICEIRSQDGVDGPLFLGKDTHALSRPAERTALEVFAANGVTVMITPDDGVVPTPVISHAIVSHNRGRDHGLADGVVVTPSHNPPADGGFKYNPSHGGPADSALTRRIERRANAILEEDAGAVRRVPFERAAASPATVRHDYVAAYVGDLGAALDMDAIRASGVRVGIDPLGGSALPFVQALGATWGIDVTVVNATLDPQFAFMTLDYDGRIRMDCSSPYAMASLIALKDDFDVAFGNDPDADRHGIVTPSAGLLEPNAYLGVTIAYLLEHRAAWPKDAKVGKTLVSSGILDRVAAAHGRGVFEVPVGFKWFAPGLADASLLFGGEESAGASFLRRDGRPWTTDKDGILLGLLAAEITARTGADPGTYAARIRDEIGRAWYRRVDRPATADQRARLAALDAERVRETELAGSPIRARLTTAPGNGASIGGLKVVADDGWFAARPSGTEAIYKVYAESFVSEAHLDRIHEEAAALVERALAAPSA